MNFNNVDMKKIEAEKKDACYIIDKLKQIKTECSEYFSSVFNTKEPEITISQEIKDILKRNNYIEKLELKDYLVSWHGKIAFLVYIGFQSKTCFKVVRYQNEKIIDNELTYIEVQHLPFVKENNYYYFQDIYQLNSLFNAVELNTILYKYDKSQGWIIENYYRDKKKILNINKIPVILCRNNVEGNSDTQIILQNIPALNKSYTVIEKLAKYAKPKLVVSRDNIPVMDTDYHADELLKQWDNEEVLQINGFNSSPDNANYDLLQFNIQYQPFTSFIDWQEMKWKSLVGMPVQSAKGTAQQGALEIQQTNRIADIKLENKRKRKEKELQKLVYIIELFEKNIRYQNIKVEEFPKVEIKYPATLELLMNPEKLQQQNQNKKLVKEEKSLEDGK